MSKLGCIHRDLATVGNVGAGLDNLHSFSLPAGSLASDGDYIRIRYAGTFAANDNDKRIAIKIDGQTAHLTGLLDIDSGSWAYEVMYVRVNATTIRASVMGLWRFIFVDGASTVLAGSNGHLETNTTTHTVADLNSNAVTLQVQAEGLADNDIIQNLSVIEISQQ